MVEKKFGPVLTKKQKYQERKKKERAIAKKTLVKRVRKTGERTDFNKFQEQKFGKTDYSEINNHIDFEREGKKSSPRKRETPVTCCACQKRFVLPFKPRRPEVYCDECYKRKRGK